MSEKKSQFIEVETLTDSQCIPVFGSGVDRKISIPNLFKQIRDESFSPFIYPTIAVLQSADLEVDVDNPTYCRCEETEYRLYKITNAAPGVDDIALTNGNTAEYQIEYRDTGFVTSVATTATGALAVFTDSTGQEIDKSVVPTNTGKAFIQATDSASIAFPRKNADNTVTMRSASQYFDDIKQNATHGAAGVIKTADGTSTLAQVATDEAITPSNLATLKASNAETLAGADDTKYITPENLQYKLASDGVLIIDNFAALASTTMAVGQVVATVGHTTAGIGSLSFIGKSGSVTNNGGTQINSATAGVYADAILGDFLSSEYFGSIADGSDETAKVQAALDAMDGRVYLLKIPVGTKFNLNNLTFPAHCTIEFSAGDDISNPSPSSDIGSGERVYFNHHSDYPADPSGGVVDEWRMTGSLNPAIIIDVRKTVSGGDAGLGSGQDRLEPARASFALHDDQTDNLLLQWQNYKTFSYFSGIHMHGWRRIFELNGIGTAQWVSVPTFGTTITGTTSGAVGQVISVDASKTTVLWFSGRFAAGETVSDNNETTVATITTAVFTLTPMPRIHQGFVRGNWGIGLPAESALRRPLLAVGGMIGVQQTRTYGQHVDETINHPGYEFVDSYESSSPNGFQIIYDTTPSAAYRRLTLRKYQTSAEIGFVGAVRACTGFTDAAIKADSGFNVASITKNGTGDYTINFTNAFARADFMVSLTTSAALEYAYVFTKTTSLVRVRVVTTGTTTLVDLTGVLDVICVGGDI